MDDPARFRQILVNEARGMARRAGANDSKILDSVAESLNVARGNGNKLDASCELEGKAVSIAFDERQLDSSNARRLILTLTRIAGAPVSETLIEVGEASSGDSWVGLVVLSSALISSAVFWSGTESLALLLCLAHLAASCLALDRGMRWTEACALAFACSVPALWDPLQAGIHFFVILILVNLSAKMGSRGLSRSKWIVFHALLALGALVFRPDLTRISAPIAGLSPDFRSVALGASFLLASYYWFSAPGRGPFHFRVCISLFIFCLLAPESSLLYMTTLLTVGAPLLIRQFLPR